MSELAALEFGQVAISNQPSFHYPYLFSYIGKPWMATPLLRQLMTETFNNGYEGYPGDEDNGTTAAWYIFSSLGFIQLLLLQTNMYSVFLFGTKLLSTYLLENN